jgi:hypothetical protein
VAAALSRREFAGGALAAGLLSTSGCSGGQAAYDAALADMTRPLGDAPDVQDLVRYATLAASGHNTQPWKFASRDNGIDIRPDFKRRTAVVDSDDHHLFASLGCAAENLSLAARARGMSGDAGFDADPDGGVHLDLKPGAREEIELFVAIPVRQCSRAGYDGKPVPPDVMKRLEAAAGTSGVDPVFLTDRKAAEDILSLVIAGNSRQMDDPAFVTELKTWIRYNASEASEKRDGLYGASSGNPTLPGWLGSIMFDLTFSKDAENKKYAEHIRSSSGIVVFVAKTNDREGWIAAGRAYQRFALQATVDGLKHAFINQAVEVPEMRRELQALLSLGERRPNLVVRFGYGPAMPKSLRRRAGDVILS